MNLHDHLKDITPPDAGRQHRFSYNLARWVRHHGKWGARIFFLPQLWERQDPTQPPVFDLTQGQSHMLFIGTYHADGAPGVAGCRLSQVLCNGAREQPGFYCLKDPQDVTDLWLPAYLERGKCAIDPRHRIYADRERWDVAEDEQTRTCRWCGATFRRREEPRTVIDTFWDAVPPQPTTEQP